MRAVRLFVPALLLVPACGSGLRRVPTGPHPMRAVEPLVVEYPPPPAQPAIIDSDPGEPCQWMDGHYSWARRGWQWAEGGWVVPRKGCYRAPAALVWVGAEQKGVLYYTAPRWYPAGAEALDEKQVLRACGEPRRCDDRGPAPAAPSEPPA